MTWHMTCGGKWTFSQNFNSLALPVWDRQCLEDSEQKDHRLNESVNEQSIYKGYTEYVKNHRNEVNSDLVFLCCFVALPYRGDHLKYILLPTF